MNCFWCGANTESVCLACKVRGKEETESKGRLLTPPEAKALQRELIMSREARGEKDRHEAARLLFKLHTR